jgi:hypothetical protein
MLDISVSPFEFTQIYHGLSILELKHEPICGVMNLKSRRAFQWKAF